jgi:hypothetical protein
MDLLGLLQGHLYFFLPYGIVCSVYVDVCMHMSTPFCVSASYMLPQGTDCYEA